MVRTLRRRLDRLERHTGGPPRLVFLTVSQDGIEHKGREITLEEARAIYHDPEVAVVWKVYLGDDGRRGPIVERLVEAVESPA